MHFDEFTVTNQSLIYDVKCANARIPPKKEFTYLINSEIDAI